MQEYDMVVVGAGPGGYVAAIRAAQLGFSVAVVEKEHLGGVCLNWGCIPTKALLRSADILHHIKSASAYGIKVPAPEIDLPKMVQRSRQVAQQLSQGIQGLLKRNKIKLFEGTGFLIGGKKLEVTLKDGKKEILKAQHILLASGARPRVLPNLPLDEDVVWFARQAMTPKRLPKNMVIVGSGAIGMEFASFYRALGTEVTVIEMQERILPQEDKEISQLAQKSFERQGINFQLKSTLKQLEIKEDKGQKSAQVTVDSQGKENILKADTVILAIGVVGNTEGLGLENTKAKVEKGQIIVDEWCQTQEPGLYAIGDVAGAPWLAHKASHEGIICVEKIANVPGVHKLNRQRIPGCTYTHPQIASIGLTEEQAKTQGKEVRVGKFPFLANGKALAMGEDQGLVKTIFDGKTGELLGAHMIGVEVTEMIQGFAVGMTLETTEVELLETIFPHPTLSEMMHESVLSAFGRTIHL